MVSQSNGLLIFLLIFKINITPFPNVERNKENLLNYVCSEIEGKGNKNFAYFNSNIWGL